MNLKSKRILAAAALLAALCLLAGCGEEQTPYEINDTEGYTVSVKYDANGGIFTTNTPVMVDSYNLSQVPVAGGKAQIALLSPDNAARGNDAFAAVKNGYFLAGWYAQRTETADGYTYAQPWDFENDILQVDAAGTYSSAEPVLTLYAAWVPLFQIDFYNLDSGDLLSSYTFDPNLEQSLLVPAWDTETGAIEMYRFPERSGYTFAGAYYDAQGTQAVTTEALVHTGTVDHATGSAQNPVMDLYVDWTEGEWYHIYNVEQFLDNASVAGSYVLHADLDFEGEIWPSALMYGNYSGTIEGNGHTMKNIQTTQTNNSKVNAGLFGYLSETAAIRDVTFENVTFTIQSGTRVAGTSYGLLAGTVSAQADISGVSILSSQILVDSGCYFGADDYVIGLVSGMGNVQLDAAQIICEATGANPENLAITVDEAGAVSLEFLNQ